MMIIGLSALVEPIARKFFKVHDDFKISSVVAVIEVLSEKRGLAAVVMVVVLCFCDGDREGVEGAVGCWHQ
jgi:hypothetical protein